MESTAYIVGTIVGSIVMGIIVGLIPFFIGRKRGHNTAGLICLVLCAVGNFIAGLFLSLPICLISTIVLLVIKRK